MSDSQSSKIKPERSWRTGLDKYCQGCASRCGGPSQCIRPVEGRGCRNCRRYGLVCVFKGTPLPPYIDLGYGQPDVLGRPRMDLVPIYPDTHSCGPCKENKTRCDLKRPCDSCVKRGIQCTGSQRACFWRGVAGDEMRGYYLTLGYGPTGVDDPNRQEDWKMPDDYHLEYIQWANERGIEPSSRGVDRPNDPIRIRLPQIGTSRPINESERNALRAEYLQLINLANNILVGGVPMQLAGIIPLLEQDYYNLTPIVNSPVVRNLYLYLDQQDRLAKRNDESMNPRLAEVPIDLTFAVGEVSDNALRRINPGSRDEHRNIGLLRNVVGVPLTRSPSPGPTNPIYWVPWNSQDQDIAINPRLWRISEDHPEYVNRSLLQREPFAVHPNENGESQLATIPYWRIWDSGDMLPDKMACETDGILGFCGKPTHSACEDTRHFTPVPICDDCEAVSLREFRELFRRLELELRQYLCSECTSNESMLDKLVNKGHRVWYPNIPRERPVPDFSAEPSVSTGVTDRVGGYMGFPLEITGCACAMKILGRRICRPHRLQYILDMQTVVSRMRDYCKSVYGRMVCPLCRERPGIDSYGFQGVHGGENANFQAWACLNCHGYVINKNGIIPINHLGTVRGTFAPPPYTVRDEERQATTLASDEVDPVVTAEEEESLWNRVLRLREASVQPDEANQPDDPMGDIYN